jgi:predicted SAM-dependent methyltransferase
MNEGLNVNGRKWSNGKTTKSSSKTTYEVKSITSEALNKRMYEPSSSSCNFHLSHSLEHFTSRCDKSFNIRAKGKWVSSFFGAKGT